jgi:hypothetical protein
MRGEKTVPLPGSEAERFGQAVHRVGGEHARARAAGRTGGTLDFVDFLVGTRLSAGLDHGIDEVDRDDLAPHSPCRLPSGRRNEDGGMFRRIAAISMPGVILSQLEMQTMASAQWALTMYSTESAIRSREGSE